MRRCLNCMSEYLDQYEDRCPHCGYLHGITQGGTMALPPGTILQGRYIVGTVIRSRDTDIFYNGWDALFDRRIIVQEYFPKYCAARSANQELSVYESKADVYQEGLNLFYFQSRELIRFYKEEDIITYHACFAENKTAYAVMEHRNYQTLREWLAGRAITIRDAVEILKEAIRITEKCHQSGMLHGMEDLDTFWMTGDGRLVLKDFGPWRYISGEPGVVHYRNANAAVDVFRLAVMFCQMITGKETEDAEKLEQELNKNRFQLKNCELKALNHALSYDIEHLQRFLCELEGEDGMPTYGAASPSSVSASTPIAVKRAKRRDAKHSLALPKWAWAAAGMIALLALVITIIGVRRIRLESGSGELAHDEVRLPNLVGRDVDEVESILRSMGLNMEQEQMDYSDEIEANKVSLQFPLQSSVLKKGDTVVVRISKGKEKAEVPLVKGLDEEEAKKQLAETGFSHISIEEDPDSQLKYGTVLSVTVEEEGAEKPKELVSVIDQLLGGKLSAAAQKKEDNVAALDAKIVLTVSRRELQPEEIEVTIPELTGINVEVAEDLLKQIEEKQLVLQPHEEYSDRPEGEIISQNPEAGSRTTESYVEVTVSKGKEQVVVTNVELMVRADAVNALETVGLKAGAISEEYSESIAAGKVISQSVNAGQLAEKGTAVNLVISKGAKPVEKAETKAEPAKTTKPAITKAQTAEAAKQTTAAVPTEVPTAEDKSEASTEAGTTDKEPESSSAAAESVTMMPPETKKADGKDDAIEVGTKPTSGSAAATQVPTAASGPDIKLDSNASQTTTTNGEETEKNSGGAQIVSGPGA
ncbi:MAG: PASTA domain-containing protein [Brotaphodocola sp.]